MSNTTITIAHAGSLTTLLTEDIAPALSAATGLELRFIAGHALGLANLIRGGLIQPDVFLSADAEVNRVLMGAPEGDRVRWFLTLAATRMVLAYSPRSRWQAEFAAAAAGRATWYAVLQRPGIVFQRSDPRDDPGGYRTVLLFQLAERFYNQPGLKDRILQGDENAQQFVRGVPAGLRDGSVDAMMLYASSAREAGLPFITLPDALDLSSRAQAAQYRTASYTNPHGQTFYGVPATYSAAIPLIARNPQAAAACIAYLLSTAGQAVFERRGFLPTPVLLGGHAAALPELLRPFVQGVYP